MHALPDDLRQVLELDPDEFVEHAAASSFPSSRGSVRTALVVTDRAVYLGCAEPEAAWTCRRHARGDVTGLEIDAQGIGEAMVAVMAGEDVRDQIAVARLDRRDFEDAGGVLERTPAVAPRETAPVVAPAAPPAETVAVDPPPVEPPVADGAGPNVFGPGRVGPPPMALPPERHHEEALGLESTQDERPFRRVGAPRNDVLGSRFRFHPNPARPGDAVRLTWQLNWPRDRKIRGVRWEFDGAERTRITVSHGKSSTTYREQQRVVQMGGTLWGLPPMGVLANMADGVLALAGAGKGEVLKAGLYEWAATVRLPDDAPPSFKGSHATVGYTGRAWVDIPARFDHRAGGQLPVDGLDRTVRPSEAYWPDKQRGLLDGLRPDITLTVRVTGGALRPGGAITGEVACADMSNKRIRGIKVELVQREQARARGHSRTVNRDVAGLTLPPPADAQPQPFTLHLPGRPCDYRGAYSSAHYWVTAKVDVAWSLDVAAEARVRTTESE